MRWYLGHELFEAKRLLACLHNVSLVRSNDIEGLNTMRLALLLTLPILVTSVASSQTLRFNRVEVREALRKIFNGRGSFVLDPKVHGKVSGTVSSASPEEVATLAHQVHAMTRVVEGVVVVIPAEPGKPAQKESDRTIVFSFQNVPLAAAVHALSLTNARAAVETRAEGNVVLAGSFPAFDEAIRAVVDSAHAALVIAGSKYTVVDLSQWTDLDWRSTHVALALTQADIRDALRQLFRQVNVNYTVAPDVQGAVSCDLHGPFYEVLTRLLAAVNCYYEMQSGVIQINAIGRTGPPPRAVNPPVVPQPVVNIPDKFRNVIVPPRWAFKDVPLAQAVRQLFARLALRYQASTPLTGKVTADLGGLPLGKAMEKLLEKKAVQLDWTGDEFIFKPAFVIPRGISLGGGPQDWMLLKRHDPVGWVTRG